MIIDARGLLCPLPIMKTKKVLDALTQPTSIEVHLDDDIAMCNVEAYLNEIDIKCSSCVDNGVYIISFTSKNGVVDGVDAPIVCDIPTTKKPAKDNVGYIVVVKELSMGAGSSELGAILMKSFMNTLAESDTLPSHIVLYNEGVNSLVVDSSFVHAYKLLESKGVKIIACGACVDYYDIKEKLALGTISNMYKIVELISASSKVMYP